MKALLLIASLLLLLVSPTKAQFSYENETITFTSNTTLYYSSDTVSHPETREQVTTIIVHDTTVTLKRNGITLIYIVQPYTTKVGIHGSVTDQKVYFSRHTDKDGDDVLTGHLYSHQAGRAIIRLVRSKEYNEVFVVMSYSNMSMEGLFYKQ